MLRLGKVCRRCKRQTESCRKCTGCNLVWYCSKDCQKEDWVNHKQTCGTSKGSSVDSPQSACHRCRELKSVLKKCTRCYSVSYCSKECQTQDWGDHKIQCKRKDKSNENKDVETTTATGTCHLCKKAGCTLWCSKCKEAYYCSKECQRQDWSTHKTMDCKIERSTPERDQARFPSDQPDIEAPFIPMGPSFFLRTGSPLRSQTMQSIVAERPPGSLERAKAFIRRRFFFLTPVVDDLDEVPYEHPLPFLRETQKDFEDCVFVAFIFKYHWYAFRHAVYIKDKKDEVTKVEFYLDYDNPFPFFSYSQVKPGNYIALHNPLIHSFMDGSVGIRIDDPSEVTIIDGRTVT